MGHASDYHKTPKKNPKLVSENNVHYSLGDENNGFICRVLQYDM